MQVLAAVTALSTEAYAKGMLNPPDEDEDEGLVTPPAEGRSAATTQKSQELQAVRTFLGSCDCANSYKNLL